MKLEQAKEEEGVVKKGVDIDGLVEKVTGLVEKRQRNIREKKERKNKLVIKGLHKEGSMNIKEAANIFLEKEFGVKEEVKRIQISGRQDKEVVIVEMDCWESKEKIMKEKKKLGSRKIYIEHDMSFEDREIQRWIRNLAKKEKMVGNEVKIGYKKLEIQGKKFVWCEEGKTLVERKNF
jgi:hypothetical protein